MEKATQKDFENTFEEFCKFGKEVLDGNDEKRKVKLEGMQYLMNSNTISIKRPIEDTSFDSQAKITKLSLVKLPNEMWMKILSYLEVGDILGNFALVNKRFHGLSLDPYAVKYLHLCDDKDKAKSKKHFKKWMEIVKRCRTLIGLSIVDINQISDWNALISETLKNNQTIKILDISICGLQQFLISTEVTKALKLAKQLQILRTFWVTFTPDFLDEICKLKSLKNFTAIKSNKSVHPEFIERLAFSKNPIEQFRIHNLDKIPSNYENGISKAINFLFSEKRDTIKIYNKFGLRKDVYINKEIDHTKCYPLPNLDVCQNITAIYENLHEHDLELISNLPKLENLFIDSYIIKDANYVEHFNHMNFSSLKSLSLKVNTTEYDNTGCSTSISPISNPCILKSI